VTFLECNDKKQEINLDIELRVAHSIVVPLEKVRKLFNIHESYEKERSQFDVYFMKWEDSDVAIKHLIKVDPQKIRNEVKLHK